MEQGFIRPFAAQKNSVVSWPVVARCLCARRRSLGQIRDDLANFVQANCFARCCPACRMPDSHPASTATRPECATLSRLCEMPSGAWDGSHFYSIDTAGRCGLCSLRGAFLTVNAGFRAIRKRLPGPAFMPGSGGGWIEECWALRGRSGVGSPPPFHVA